MESLIQTKVKLATSFNLKDEVMVKELMHDPIFLAGKSEVATKEDLQDV